MYRVGFKTFIRSYTPVAFWIILGMVLLFLDFFTKAYIYHLFPFHDSCAGCPAQLVFSHFLGIDFWISLATNRGAAWGMFADFQIPLLILRLSLILGLLFYLFFVNTDSNKTLPFVFILSGALGNVVDFFLYGFVVDFLYFNLWGYPFPLFNFADAYITIGVACLILILLFSKHRQLNE